MLKRPLQSSFDFVDAGFGIKESFVPDKEGYPIDIRPSDPSFSRSKIDRRVKANDVDRAALMSKMGLLTRFS